MCAVCDVNHPECILTPIPSPEPSTLRVAARPCVAIAEGVPAVFDGVEGIYIAATKTMVSNKRAPLSWARTAHGPAVWRYVGENSQQATARLGLCGALTSPPRP